MKLRNVILLCLISLLLLILLSCNKSYNDVYISLSDVSSMEIYHGGNYKATYTPDKNHKEIEYFLKALTEAKPYDNSVGTTPDSNVYLLLKNGDRIYISGGSQGFQTVVIKENQFNIQSNDLWNFFKSLNREYDTQ